MGKVHPRMGRRGPSRVRPGQVADAMRVRAGVAPRVASGDPAASKGKSAGGCSSFKVALEGCTLRNNATGCEEEDGGTTAQN